MLEIMSQQTTQDNNLYLLEKRYELLIEINNKKLMKEIVELREIITKLSEEMQTIKSSQKQIQQNAFQDRFPQKITQPNNNVDTQKRDLHSEDVSIEKYFYFGNK